MDNIVIPYKDDNSSSDDELDDTSSNDEHSHLLSNNIGIYYNKYINDNNFINMENADEYKQKRNQLFTPEIEKKIITINLTSQYTTKSLEENFNLSSKNIIGFKILKSVFLGDGLNSFVDLLIPELPDKVCDKNELGQNIFARIPLRKITTDFYTHQFLELSLINRYFYPVNLNTLNFNLSLNLSGWISIEITYFNKLL